MTTASPGAAQAGVSTSDRLTPYVPRIAIEWLRETPNARHKHIDGSLAFVDISGFTALTERLSKKGKAGAEEMNDLLNGCFTELLSVAYDQGAGVIKWGGDAVLLLFHGDEHEARACRAALDMQRTMRSVGKLRTSSGLVTLRMSIGIHSGVFDFFLVGDLHRELVITGPGASTTVEMEAVAEAGEVAISPSTAAAIEPRCLGEERSPAILLRRAPQASSERSSPVEDVADLDLAQLLPLDIREHLVAGGGEAEHRPMTPAFIHFMGADELLAEEGPAALADALDFIMRSVQRAAHDHQVAFFETDIAPSGGKVMLMGGAPSSSGNDEERMLRAMRAVLDAGSPLPLRIGVSWGRIFVGDFGPPYRRAYSVKGDSVNLAARLMAKAEPGQLLTTDDVLERSRTRFDTLALDPFQAKGKEELVQAYVVGSPLGLKERSASAPLVGREDELSVLIEALDMARRYEGRIVELVADPGMGKSRLVEELRATAEGVAVRSVQCEEYESATPYFTFRDLLRDLVGATVEQGSDAAERRLRLRVETSAPHLEPWLPLLAVPFGLTLPDTPETALLGDEFRKSRLEEATRELLGMLLLEPTMLVFEDAHWMDDASADLLRELTRGLEQRPWLIVATRRDQPSGFTAPEAAAPVVIELQPLGAAQAAALAHAATEELPLQPHEIDALTERAGGNPLFLTELLVAAQQAGGLAELPDSVETLMMAQIDRLSPTDRRVLRCAAVIGTSFAKELVDAALAPDAPARETWERLSEFLTDDDGHLRFRHDLVRDAAYEGLPYRRRREIHGRVGATIEGRAGNRADDEAELLSLHFFHAHDFDKAWRYSRIAGERAQGMYANVEAATFFDRALASTRRASGLARESSAVWEALGDVTMRLGEFERSEKAFKAARHHAGADPLEQSRLLLKQAAVTYWRGSYPQTIRRVNRGLKPLEGLRSEEASAQRARLYTRYGAVRRRQGRRLEAIAWFLRAIDEAEIAGARDALAHAYYVLDLTYVELGRYEEAVHSEQALAIYEELGDVAQQAAIHNNLGMLAYFEGRWDDAVPEYEIARGAWERAGDRWSASYAMCNSAEILSDQGRLEEGEALLRGALRIARASRSDARIADVSAYLGRHLARSGLFEEALELLESAREEFERGGDRSEVFGTDVRIAECLALQGDAEPALDLATTALDRAGSLEGVHTWIPVLHRVRGWALMQLGRLPEADAALRESLAQARANGADYEASVTLAALVVLGQLGGEPVDELDEERRASFERLGVISVAQPPVVPTVSAV